MDFSLINLLKVFQAKNRESIVYDVTPKISISFGWDIKENIKKTHVFQIK